MAANRLLLSGAGAMEDDGAITARPVQMRFHDLQGEASGRGRIKGIAAALQRGGFANQDCLGLYGPNDGMLLVVLLAMWRANGKWIPVNTRNAIDANAAYINYVRLKWLVYHSSKADEVQQLKDLCPTLQHFVCLDRL